jgi:hypothetical protein
VSLFEKPSHKIEVKGELGYFGLEDWWLSTFSEEERGYFERTYRYLSVGGDNGQPLTHGDIYSLSRSSIFTLTGIIGALRDKPEYLHLVKPILQEAERRKDGNALDFHFLYGLTARVTYALRGRHPDALNTAIDACKRQIAVAPQAADMFKLEIPAEKAQRILGARLPGHDGYTRLSIIYEHEKRYAEVIELATQAESQGWNGDWDKRIARCEKRLSKP